AGDTEQHAQGLPQRPVPPPAALDLDLDPGVVEPAPSGPGEPPGAPRPARTARAAPTAPAPTPDRREIRRPQAAGGLVLPVKLRGFLGTRRRACRWARRARVASVMAPPGRAAVIRAHRGADTAAAGVAGSAGFLAGIEARFRSAE